MNDFSDTRTVAIKPCIACSAGMVETDRYCRWCGARQQTSGAAPGVPMDRAAAVCHAERGAPSTRGLDSNVARLGGTVSGPLISAIVERVGASSRALSLSRTIRRLIVALVAAPLWLIVVLLSPIDAYVALKGLSSELHR